MAAASCSRLLGATSAGRELLRYRQSCREQPAGTAPREHRHRSVSSLHQPDVDFTHFLRDNLLSGRSRLARQIGDVVNGRSDVVLKPLLGPASRYLPACRRWWAGGARYGSRRQRRWCLPLLGHLLEGSCRVKSRLSSWWRPRWGRKRSKLALRPHSGRPGWRSWVPVARRDRPRWFSHRLWSPPPLGLPWKLLGGLGGDTKDGTAAGSWIARFGSLPPLTAWFLPSRPLPPLVSKHQRETRNSVSWGGGGAHRHVIYVPSEKNQYKWVDIWLFTNNHLCQFIEIVHRIINCYMKNVK